MPEYSSTTLTPTNETKVPAMQNNNSGNFQLDALKAYILAEKAQANGLASLDATGKLVSSQIPDNLDDVLVYGSYALLPATGVEGKIYITADTNSMYRWDASLETPDYVMLAVDLEEYATKAELQAETNQRKASDSRLESRLENLEQKAGDYTTVQYRGTNAVPTGKAKNGLVEKIVGKSRAWNQVFTNVSLSSTTEGGITYEKITSPNYAWRISGTATESSTKTFFSKYNLVAGHVYFLGDVYVVSGKLWVESTNWTGQMTEPAKIFTAGSTPGNIVYHHSADFSLVSPITVTPILRDLTLIFGAGNEPSTVADALAQLPALGQYNPYDAGSLVDTAVSGVKSVGVNIWDEEAESGGIDGSTGENTVNNAIIRSKNYTKVSPNTAYYFRIGTSETCKIVWYDANKNFISSVSSASGANTSPVNACYVRFQLYGSYGTTYLNDIQICLNSYTDKTTYHPHILDTLSLSETVTLKSAGSVSDELDVESGVVTHPVGTKTFNGSDGWELVNSSDGYYRYDLVFPHAPSQEGCSSKYEVRTGSIIYNGTYFLLHSDGNKLSFVTTISTSAGVEADLNGSVFNYELATPTTESIDPITDNFIEVEGGGTIDTIQEQTTVIDNCLDVGYLTL